MHRLRFSERKYRLAKTYFAARKTAITTRFDLTDLRELVGEF
jgi:hypothetical protein